VSTVPNAFIAHCFCPACRYELTGLPYADPVKCPECGVATETGDLPLAPPPGPLARFFALPPEPRRRVACVLGLAFASLVIAGLVLPLFVPICSSCCGGGWQLKAAVQLREIHRSLRTYAGDTTGLYPAHAAVLVPPNYYQPDFFLDFRAAVSNGAVVGDVDLLLYDWSPEATAQLNAAIASCDVSAAYYRIGDFWLVRLPEPTGSPKLIAGWCDLVVDGERWVVFDDNQVKAIDRDDWGRIWRTDAGERARLGLPRVPAPWWSADGGRKRRRGRA
jgi:hypothetical protein